MRGGEGITGVVRHALIVFLIGLLLSPLLATGEMLTISIDVQSGGAEGGLTQSAWTIDWDDVYANPDETYVFDLPFVIEIAQDTLWENKIAKVNSLHIAVKADPVIELGFDVEALIGDVEFTISIDGPPLTFEAMDNPLVEASVAMGYVSGTLTGGYDNSKAYRAYYNGSSVLADLISPITGTGLLDPAIEDSSTQQLSGPVSSISGQWQFTLTEGGRASGVGGYVATAAAPAPEPASMLLLGLGGLTLLRKRKK